MSFRSFDDETDLAWLELWRRARAPVWLHPEWTRLWWNAFGTGRLALACVRRDGRLVAVAPTAIGRGEIRSLANGHSPAWGILAEDADGLDTAARALVSRGLRLDLFPLRADEETAPAIARAAAEAGYGVLTRELGISPTIDISADGGHSGAISPRRRRDIRRRWRRLADEGALSFDLRDDPSGFEPALERCFAVEAAGWKGEEGTAIAARAETARFYRELAAWAGREGWFKIAELRMDDRTMAFDLALEHDGVHYLLKTSFDPAYARFSPGTLLRDAIVSRVFDVGLRRYEFLGRLDGWKREWTHTGHPMIQIRAFPGTPAGAAARLAFAAAWRARERLRER